MSGNFASTRRSRTRSPIHDYSKKSLLVKVSKSELKLLRVAVRRNDIIASGPQLPLERSIDDPARICIYVHYRKDEHKRLQPPIFGKGIKVNQIFTENRHVFTHEKQEKDDRSSRKSRSTSRYRSRSPRNRTRSSSRTKRPRSQERDRNNRSKRSSSFRKSRSRGRSKSKRKGSRSRRDDSRSKDRRYSSERRRYKDDSRQYSSRRSRYSRSPSQPLSFHGHEPSCPMYEGREHKKSLTPLRPGEYRPGHPDLVLRNKRLKTRSRSRSYDETRSKRSYSRENLPSTSKDRSSPGKHAGSSKTSRRYQSPGRRERRSRSRSSIKSDRYKRRSRSPYNHSPVKRYYKGDKSRSPRRRSRSPQYGENIHGEYGYYEGWGPGPRLPAGRGGYPMQPFYAPPFHPRGMIPGALIPPGHMIVPRMPIIPPYGPYRPHLPIYNSGAVRQRGPRPSIKPSSTVTSEKDKVDGDGSRVIVAEASSQDSDKNEDAVQPESTDNINEKDGDKATEDEK